MTTNHLNSQIVDSVAATHRLTYGQASAQSLAILEAVSAETIGTSMHNAVRSQSNAQMLSSAAITAACARIIGTPSQPMIVTVPTPPTHSPDTDTIASQRNRALDGVQHLVNEREQAERDSDDASQALREIADRTDTKHPGTHGDPAAGGGDAGSSGSDASDEGER